MPLMQQGAEACASLLSDERTKNKAVDIVAFSMGNMVARYLIEVCDIEVRRYAAFGGPLTGISKPIGCNKPKWWCGPYRRFSNWVQYTTYL